MTDLDFTTDPGGGTRIRARTALGYRLLGRTSYVVRLTAAVNAMIDAAQARGARVSIYGHGVEL